MLSRFVRIVEVGARDGLQNERLIVSTGDKLKFIQMLSKTGVNAIEATSFVSPKWVPQMADSTDIVKGLSSMFTKKSESKGLHFPVLIPNMKGLDTFLKVRSQNNNNGIMDEVAIFTAASEGFSQSNTNCSIAESLERMKAVAKAALEAGLRVRGYVSCIVKCPFDGAINPDAVLRVSSELLNYGCYEVSLGDTIGAARGGDMARLLNHVLKRVDPSVLAIHCHDTYGQALENISKALEMGIRTVDSSCAGLGGCPYAPAAPGNVATEDVVHMLKGDEKYACGVDLDAVIKAGDFITQVLGIKRRSKFTNKITDK